MQYGAGEKDKTYRFVDVGGLYTFNCHIKDTDLGKQISILTKNELDCVIIYIDKIKKVAVLSSMSYDNKCAKEGLPKPGGGTILLRFALNLIIWNSGEYNIKRIILKDNSYIPCKNCPRNIELSRLRTFTKGQPWYVKFGFLPYDPQTEQPSNELLKSMQRNADLVKKIKTNELNIINLIKKSDIKNIQLNEINKLASKYVLLRDFIIKLLEDYQTYCCLIQLLLKELYNPEQPEKAKLYDFYGKSFYFDI